jgi:hypothetical protein
VADDPFGEEAGVSLGRYAELGVALFGKEGEERDAIMRAHGIDAVGVDAAVAGWTRRMQGNPAVALAYNGLYQRAMVAAGVRRPDVHLETYAQMVGEISAGTPTEEVCRRHGMDLQEFALLSQHWGAQMGRDPALAQRFASLVMAGRGTTPAAPPPPPATGLTI